MVLLETLKFILQLLNHLIYADGVAGVIFLTYVDNSEGDVLLMGVELIFFTLVVNIYINGNGSNACNSKSYIRMKNIHKN